jgi:hypothetical protein
VLKGYRFAVSTLQAVALPPGPAREGPLPDEMGDAESGVAKNRTTRAAVSPRIDGCARWSLCRKVSGTQSRRVARGGRSSPHAYRDRSRLGVKVGSATKRQTLPPCIHF